MKNVKMTRPFRALFAALVLSAVLFGTRAYAFDMFYLLSPSGGSSYNFGEEIPVQVSPQMYIFAYSSGFQIPGPNHVIVEITKKGGETEAKLDFAYGNGNLGKLPPLYFTPKKTGTYTLRAYWTGVTGQTSSSDSANISRTFTVIKAPVSQVTVTGDLHNMAPGTSCTLGVDILPENAYDQRVKWSSSNTKVATVNKDGVVKIKKNAGGKTVTITAAARDGSKTKGTWKIRVMKSPVKKITIDCPKATIYPGESVQLTAAVFPAKGTLADVTWSVDKPEYAEISCDGVLSPYTAGKGKSVKVIATAADGTGIRKTVTVKIGNALQAFTTDLVKGKINITSCGKDIWTKLKDPVEIEIGDKLVFLKGGSASISKITYKSSNGKVMSIKNGTATAKKAGNVTITIKLTKTNKKSLTAKLKFKVVEPCKYPYVDDCSFTRYGLFVNGKEIKNAHEPFILPENIGDSWTYGPVEDILKALGVKYVKAAGGSRIGGTLNGHVFYIKDGVARMEIDGSGHLYGYGENDEHSTPNMYEDVLFAPINFFDCFAEGARVTCDGKYTYLDLEVDTANSGAYGITASELLED